MSSSERYWDFQGDMPDRPYFELLARQSSSVSAKDYAGAAAAARETLPLVRAWLMDPRGEGRRQEISIPAFEQGGTMMAFIGDIDGLHELRDLVRAFDFLGKYSKDVDAHFVDIELFERIRAIIRCKPGILQAALKEELGLEDGHRIARLVAYLDKAGEIRRARRGKSHELYMADVELSPQAAATIHVEPPKPGSHRKDARPSSPRVLDKDSMPVVPLPPSPAGWEHAAGTPRTEDDFADPAGSWRDILVQPIAMRERPDPAFRRHYSTRGGTLSFDLLANSESSIGKAGSVVFADAKGRLGTPAPLHRAGWVSVHPEGQGFASLSRSHVLSVYDEHLQLDFETDLARAPEVIANAARLGMVEEEAATGLRCIALTPDRSRYIFTHVDEAWCITRDGDVLWGIRMLENQGHEFEFQLSRFGTASQIGDALRVMDLGLPVSPEDIRRRYRQLVRQHHPDINPGGTERMKAVNVAAELLTGLSSDELNAGPPSQLTATFTTPAWPDRITEAAFSGTGETAIIATFSGRVLRVDDKGRPITIHDVGQGAGSILETASYLYVKTATRLYVLQGDRLVALEDCPVKCDLLVTGGILLLVEGKGIRVFTEDGRPRGLLLTKAPIRRAYVDDGELVVETRTERARCVGLRPAS